MGLNYKFIFDGDILDYCDPDTLDASLRESDIQPKDLTDEEVRTIIPGDMLEYTVRKDGRQYRVTLTVESRRYVFGENGQRKVVFLSEGLIIKKI